MVQERWLSQMLKNKDIFIFDLDQTLYPKASNIIKQIDNRIGAYCARIMNVSFEEGCRIGWKMNDDYGSTLGGLKVQYPHIDAAHYLEDVHNVDYSELTICHNLKGTISSLQGRKIIYTNGTKAHAERVLEKRGLTNLFEDIHDIEAANHIAKPCPNAFKEFINLYNIDICKSVFFDDNHNNVKTAEKLGISSFHVLEGEQHSEGCSSIKNLALFLKEHT